jgi:hypothetical protein
MDAWKQLNDLIEAKTQKYEVRSDIRVYARGCQRGVEVSIGDFRDGKGAVKSTGKRNVSTMRELAKAINDACDKVEELNPIWANITIEEIEGER